MDSLLIYLAILKPLAFPTGWFLADAWRWLRGDRHE